MIDQLPQPNPAPIPQWVPVPTPGVPETPPKKSLPTWVRTIIVALMTLVGIGLIGLFVWGVFFAGGRREVAVVESELSQAIADCRANAQDVDSCIANAAMRLAQENGDGSFCKEYQADEKDDCYMLAALTAGDAKLCNDVKDEEKQSQCTNAVVAATDGDCENYTDSTLQGRCDESEILAAALAGDCNISGVTGEMCEAGRVIRQAQSARNPGLCSQIVGDLNQTCIELVGEADLDLDGVVADDERIAGTSDTNPDTDGDGYDDKTEIDNGFDPLN